MPQFLGMAFILVTNFVLMGLSSTALAVAIYDNSKCSFHLISDEVVLKNLKNELLKGADSETLQKLHENLQIAWAPKKGDLQLGFRTKSTGELQAFVRASSKDPIYEVIENTYKMVVVNKALAHIKPKMMDAEVLKHNNNTTNEYLIALKTEEIDEKSSLGVLLESLVENPHNSLKALGLKGTVDKEVLSYHSKGHLDEVQMLLTAPTALSINQRISSKLDNTEGLRLIPFHIHEVPLEVFVNLTAKGYAPVAIGSHFVTDYTESLGSLLVSKSLKSKITSLFSYLDQIQYSINKFQKPFNRSKVFSMINDNLRQASKSLHILYNELTKALSATQNKTEYSKNEDLQFFKILLNLESIKPLLSLNPQKIKDELLDEFKNHPEYYFYKNDETPAEMLSLVESIEAPEINFSQQDIANIAEEMITLREKIQSIK